MTETEARKMYKLLKRRRSPQKSKPFFLFSVSMVLKLIAAVQRESSCRSHRIIVRRVSPRAIRNVAAT
jgi:hypothetical protein